ncbi:SDR family oxidoreductase [Streptomyces sp. NPDC057623]|uniref:SDR family oxidoreductase n=1 Tax=Streptomyces sp. NPDC057623 TaxID=3346187 RepID=UPI0036C811DC
MNIDLDPSDRRVLSTGGLGIACACGFPSTGAQVALADANNVAMEQLTDATDPTLPTQVDPSSAESSRAAMEKAAVGLGDLDTLMHTVEIKDRRSLLGHFDEDWQLSPAGNLLSAYRPGQAAGRTMCEQRAGHLVFVPSASRLRAPECTAAGVGVNAVARGSVNTICHLESPEVRDGAATPAPAGRLGTPEKIPGRTCPPDLTAFVTGQVLHGSTGRTLA